MQCIIFTAQPEGVREEGTQGLEGSPGDGTEKEKGPKSLERQAQARVRLNQLPKAKPRP